MLLNVILWGGLVWCLCESMWREDVSKKLVRRERRESDRVDELFRFELKLFRVVVVVVVIGWVF